MSTKIMGQVWDLDDQFPNHTPIPNYALDSLRKMNGGELKIFCLICRKTIGQSQPKVALNDLEITRLTCLKKHQIKASVERLIKKGLIVRALPFGTNPVYSIDPQL